MTKERISITIEKQLLKDIDRIRGYIPRSTFIDKFLERYLSFQTAEQLLNKNTGGNRR